MSQRQAMVVFRVDQQRYALPLTAVERVVRVVELTPWPHAPAKILGAINVQGAVLPVVSFRRWLGRPDRDVELDDQLLLVRIGGRRLALLTDQVSGVLHGAALTAVPGTEVTPEAGAIGEVLKLADGLVLVPDLEQLLTAAEAGDLSEAVPPAEAIP
jgi:purine-binding chemotaxis protein CheW